MEAERKEKAVSEGEWGLWMERLLQAAGQGDGRQAGRAAQRLCEAGDSRRLAGPLALAAKLGLTDLLAMFLDAGADPGSAGPGRFSALMAACGAQREACAKKLLCSGADPMQRDEAGHCALHYGAAAPQAADEGLAKGICALLLDEGCDADASRNDGKSALMMAIGRGRYAVALYLSEVSDPWAKDAAGAGAGEALALAGPAVMLLPSARALSESLGRRMALREREILAAAAQAGEAKGGSRSGGAL